MAGMVKYGGSHINDFRRTEGHKGHSSKPTTFHGIEGEGQRYMHQGPAGHTRRQHKLFPGQRQAHIKLPDDYEAKLKKYHGSKKKIAAYNKAHGITGGRRRRGSRYTRRR